MFVELSVILDFSIKPRCDGLCVCLCVSESIEQSVGCKLSHLVRLCCECVIMVGAFRLGDIRASPIGTRVLHWAFFWSNGVCECMCVYQWQNSLFISFVGSFFASLCDWSRWAMAPLPTNYRTLSFDFDNIIWHNSTEIYRCRYRPDVTPGMYWSWPAMDFWVSLSVCKCL